jgi:hypothetical protein
MTQYAAPATSGLLATPLETYNWNPSTQLSVFLAAERAGDASIVFVGDSVTAGVGSEPSNSADTAGGYPEETAYWLNQEGIAAQAASALGDNNNGVNSSGNTPQLTFANGGGINGASGIDGPTILLSGRGSSVTFKPEYPISANQVEAQTLGSGNSNPLQVAVDGTVVGTITPESNDLFNNQTLDISNATTTTSVTLTNEGTGSQYLEGIETNNTAFQGHPNPQCRRKRRHRRV